MDTDIKPIKILVIEDNPGDVRLIMEVLSRGMAPTFRIESRETLSHGLERLREGNIDLILLDLQLPDSIGIETFQRVHQEAAGIPIIILSGLEDDKFALESVQKGAQDYLLKGHIEPDNMRRAIRYAIERKKVENELKEAREQLEKVNKGLEEEITERKRAEEQIKASLTEKEVMLKEIHHRVKNNLQLINSLLSLQSSRIDNEKNRTVFDECKNRVNSIALVHEKLYDSKDLANINFGQYIRTLTNQLFTSHAARSAGIGLKINTADIFLEINKAIPCSLILNELITNALKHGFLENRQGEIAVELKSAGKGVAVLIVADNGAGLPPGFDIGGTKTLGMQIINALVRQLHGSIKIDAAEGSKFTVEFQINDEL